MEEEIANVFNQRPKRQLVYPFLELENQEKNDITELWKEGRNMAEVVEISEDGRLLSIKEDPEIY
jgi:hypothetical protein